MIRRLITVTSIISSALLSSQAPEFAQQYRQRLGGAVDELTIVVNDFDNDAAKVDLSRQQALYDLASSDKEFFQARASSLQTTFNRYESLSRQQNIFNSLDPALRPAALFTAYDAMIINGTLDEYQPALPLTIYGAIWTVFGGIFGWLLTLLLVKPFSKKSKKRTVRQGRRTPRM